MSLHLDLTAQRGSFELRATLDVAEGEVLALLGPNGSGKTTLLSVAAGLLRPTVGTVRVGQRMLSLEPAPGERLSRVEVPPSARRVGLLGQDPLLFPHLSALENVAFGPRAAGMPVREARSRAWRLLGDMGLGGLEDRRPSALSGGQQQRVAIARALAAEPEVLLLDEPLAALDVENAALLRRLLRDRIADARLTTVLVTHDLLDAVALADRVAILHEGTIVDQGPTARVLGRPANGFVASLVGLNLLSGVRGADGAVVLDDGRRIAGRTEGSVEAGAAASAVFRPAAVELGRRPSPDAALNSWPATIAWLEPSSGGVRIRMTDGTAADAAAGALPATGMEPGDTVQLSVPPDAVTIYATRGDG